jgi:hypothetical protein
MDDEAGSSGMTRAMERLLLPAAGERPSSLPRYYCVLGATTTTTVRAVARHYLYQRCFGKHWHVRATWHLASSRWPAPYDVDICHVVARSPDCPRWRSRDSDSLTRPLDVASSSSAGIPDQRLSAGPLGLVSAARRESRHKRPLPLAVSGARSLEGS